MRRLPRYWLTRLYVALSILSKCTVAHLVAASLIAVMLQGSAVGWALIAVLFALGLIALADVAVNDLMPERFSFQMARDRRHLIYNSIALGTLGLCYAIVRREGFTPVLLPYLIDAAVAAALAVLDLFARHREC